MKRYLLDTCAISDMRDARPNPGLLQWFTQSDAGTLYLSTLSIGEIQWGIERLSAGKKRSLLEHWLADDVIARFNGRLLHVDLDLAVTWGRIRALATKAGNNCGTIDSLLAATAVHHDLILVTRNTKDFAGTNVPIVNPWS